MVLSCGNHAVPLDLRQSNTHNVIFYANKQQERHDLLSWYSQLAG